jgi:hypothetical protein
VKKRGILIEDVKMGTIVIRNKKGMPGFSFSEEARKRAYEHLKSLGYTDDELRPIEWPQDAVSAYRDNGHAAWKFTTIADILRRKRDRMENNLRWKREHEIIERRTLYVWVFWCPGISGFFRGWWTYLVGHGGDYCSGGHKGEVDGVLKEDLLRLFPLVEKRLFDTDWNLWMRRFVKKYRRGVWCGKPQGKAPLWAQTEGNRVLKILGRAQWPNGDF